MTTHDPTTAQAPVLLAAALQELAREYPTDPDDTATVTLTVTDPATGEQHQAHLQPGHLRWLTTLVMDEMTTCRNAHSDGTGQCGHCTTTR
ncbi:hypothetical protein AB0424_28570 [Streptomyces sp. NPDC051180]|uniref:hypothetical protein n=1 Tax=unclassified Streptomyces TaxID=2593676 RepID=UPI00344D5A12